MKKILIILIIAAVAFVAKNELGKKKFSETMTDTRDGKVYGIARIGNQVWMAENLNYEITEKLCHGGTAICNCCLDDKKRNCDKYGRTYAWNEAMKACPTGWHLPAKWEWDKLVETAGGELEAGKALKSTSGWRFRGNGEDTYGFSALPSDGRGQWAVFWTSSEINSDVAQSVAIGHDFDGMGEGESDKNFLFSIRCIKD